MRKGVILLMILVAYCLDVSFSMKYIWTAVMIAFITNEVVSIVENMEVIGIPLSAVITRAINGLKSKSDVKE